MKMGMVAASWTDSECVCSTVLAILLRQKYGTHIFAAAAAHDTDKNDHQKDLPFLYEFTTL